VSNDGVDVRMSDDRLFHTRGPTTVNTRSPMVIFYYILYIKDNLEWSLRSSNGFQPRNSNIEEGLPLEYCVGDGEVMTLAVSIDFGRLHLFNVAQAARCLLLRFYQCYTWCEATMMRMHTPTVGVQKFCTP